MSIWQNNPFHTVHFANEKLWEIAQVLNGKPKDDAAAEKIARILRGIGYNIEPESEAP